MPPSERRSSIACTKLQKGDKGLVGNAGYRRFLAIPKDGHFEIDPARVTEDARFDGIYAPRTNSKLPVLWVALAYRQLWKVEAIFRTAKSILEARPMYHQSDAAIVGHLFCSFLALLLRKELDERLIAAGVTVEWDDVVRDLYRVEQVTVEQNAKRFMLRPDAPGCAVGVALAGEPAATCYAIAARRHRATTPSRTPAAWCHAPLNFPHSASKSTGSRFMVSNFSLTRQHCRWEIVVRYPIDIMTTQDPEGFGVEDFLSA
jgi:hypothetical protein